MRRSPVDTGHSWAAWGGEGGYSVISVNPDIALYPSTRIYRGSDLRTPRTAFLITGFHCIPVESIEPSTKQQILDSSELKEFADDNFECTENYRTFSK